MPFMNLRRRSIPLADVQQNAVGEARSATGNVRFLGHRVGELILAGQFGLIRIPAYKASNRLIGDLGGSLDATPAFGGYLGGHSLS